MVPSAPGGILKPCDKWSEDMTCPTRTAYFGFCLRPTSDNSWHHSAPKHEGKGCDHQHGPSPLVRAWGQGMGQDASKEEKVSLGCSFKDVLWLFHEHIGHTPRYSIRSSPIRPNFQMATFKAKTYFWYLVWVILWINWHMNAKKCRSWKLWWFCNVNVWCWIPQELAYFGDQNRDKNQKVP